MPLQNIIKNLSACNISNIFEQINWDIAGEKALLPDLLL